MLEMLGSISQSKKKLIRIRIVDIGNSDKYLALEYEYNKGKFKEEQKIVVTMSNMSYIDMKRKLLSYV